MVIECRDELVVRKSFRLALIGSIALTNKGLFANSSMNDAGPTEIVATVHSSSGSGEAKLKTRMNCKKNLAAAKSAKRDEFYTQYIDIKRELDLYYKFNKDVFRGKIIYMPCDDPRVSNFTRYFLDNYNQFGIKRIICTCYNSNGKGLLFDYERSKESDTLVSPSQITCRELVGDGDFRSEEVTELCKQADIIITNPPFSLFRQFFNWVMSSKKQFLIIGSVNCISYKEVYPYIMKNEVWLGHGIGRWISGFIVPGNYELYGTETRVDEDGNHIIASNSCLWLTNIDHERRHQPLKLMTREDNIKHSKHRDVRLVGYVKYDNCDAIEVPHTDAIPSDYKGLMGVPITFLDKYCPDQFDLVRFRKGDDGKDLTLNGKPTYFRILIKAKNR